jgi:heat shock protein HslJ
MKKLIIMIAIVIGFSATAQAKEINLGCETNGKQWNLYLNTVDMTGTRSDENRRGKMGIQSSSYTLVINKGTEAIPVDILKTVIDRSDLSVTEEILVDMNISGMAPINKVFTGKCQIKEAPKNQI